MMMIWLTIKLGPDDRHRVKRQLVLGLVVVGPPKS